MQNLDPGALHHSASYLSGRHEPLYMMEGLDGSSTRGSWSPVTGDWAAHAILSHTYNPLAVWEARLS